MGEARKDAVRLNFDRKLRLEFHRMKITSDAGLLACRELNEELGLTTMVESEFRDNRDGKNARHRLTALLKQPIQSRSPAYEKANNAECLRTDPPIKLW